MWYRCGGALALHRSCVLAFALGTSCALTYDPKLAVARAHSLFGQGSPRGETAQVGAPRLDATADLAACLRYGLRQNAELKAAFERWRAATHRVEQVATLPEPMLSFAHVPRPSSSDQDPYLERGT